MNRFSPIALVAVALAVALGACATDPTPSPAAATMTDAPTEDPEPTAPGSAAATPSSTPSDPPDSETPTDPLLAVELTDVRSGETFTLGELAAEHGPVLLEPMAVWCSSCRSQQREVVAAHREGSFSSVSLDVDLSEAPEDLAAYADREGFDWYFAMADAELYRALQERFDVAVTNPPSTPLIIIGVDGSVRALEFGRGVRSADQLLDELGAG